MVVEDAHPRAEICITESLNDVSNTIVIRVTKGNDATHISLIVPIRTRRIVPDRNIDIAVVSHREMPGTPNSLMEY